MLKLASFVVRQANKKNAIPPLSKGASALFSSSTMHPAAESQSFAMNIFLGKLVPDQVVPFPEVLTTDQSDLLKQLINPTQKFFEERYNPAKFDEMEKVDDATLKELADLGAFGLQAAEDLGGVGLSNTQYARMVEIVGAHDLGLGIVLGAHQSIGYKGIMLYGNDAQKQKYVPDLAAGKIMAAYCLTEPTSGSDAASIQSRAVKSPDGKHYILNGSKIWISNGGVADVFTVFAQTKVKDDKGVEKDKITAFIVERGFGGVTHSPPEKKMGIKASNTAALYFDNCKIPAENVLGGEGNGFKVAMNILNNGRFGMAAALSGTMRAAISKAAQHAAARRQFGSHISQYGTIQEKLARMTMRQYITEAMAFLISGNMDRGVQDFQVEAAISKVYGSESAWYCCDEAIQILGGMGFMKETGLEKVLRDLRIFRIFEGSNDILRLFAVLTSLQYAGKGLKDMAANPMANIGQLVSMASGQVMKALGSPTGVSADCAAFKSKCHNSLHPSVELCAQAVGELGEASRNLLLKHKKGVVDRQFELNRLADAAIDIYCMAVGISRASRAIEKNLSTADLERQIVTLFCNDAHRRVLNNLRALSHKSETQNMELMKSISHEVCSNGGIVYSNPLGF